MTYVRENKTMLTPLVALVVTALLIGEFSARVLLPFKPPRRPLWLAVREMLRDTGVEREMTPDSINAVNWLNTTDLHLIYHCM